MRNRPKPYTLVAETNHYLVRGGAHFQEVILRRNADGSTFRAVVRAA
jgi:hypothetical protein